LISHNYNDHMKKPHLILCFLLALSACDSPPGNGAKAPPGDRAVIVEAALAQLSDVARTIERNGNLHAHREVRLSLQQEGVLLTLPYHEGDQVAQGALLAQLDDALLRAQLKKAVALRHQAEQDLNRLKRLQSSRVVSEDELARAVTALDVARAEEEELNILLQQTRITAPFDGIISQRLAEPGDSLSRFSHVLTLIDISHLTTELQLSEMVLTGLQIGDEVSLSIDALGPQRFAGTLKRIHPVVDEVSHQGTIEVILSPAPAGAQPGQLCRVRLQLRGRARLLVPYNTLRRDTRGEFLFVIDSGNKVERRSIVSGLHFEEMVEVLDGLSAGERIVTRGFLGLSEGGTVKLAGGKPTP
jgi:RND family efflux transporter MFP subunit